MNSAPGAWDHIWVWRNLVQRPVGWFMDAIDKITDGGLTRAIIEAEIFMAEGGDRDD